MDEPKLCASCKTRPVAGKRKDAIYCTDPKCRKDAHLKRKEQAAQLPPTLSANKSSLIITFPDGRRCLIELTLLDSVAPTTLPSLTQVPNTPTENGSGSTPVQTEPISGIEGSGQIQTDQILHSLVQQTALPTSLQDAPDQIQNRLPESAPTSAPSVNAQSGQPDSHSASTSTDIAPSAFVPTAPQDAGRAEASVTSQVRTVELYFVDEAGRVLTFEKAVRRREDLSWRLKWHAKAMLGFSPSEGHGLGGRPGRWRDTYPGKAPTEFGLEQDIGVLYYDAATDRRSAASPELLVESFGPGWREQVRRSAGRIP
jgi:hypothetical protein